MKIIAVIGLGNIARRHRKNLKKIYPQALIYAVSSSGRSVVEEIEHSDFVLDNIDSLLFLNIDLVIVASPAPYHATHSIPFLEKGVPVLIEKPITASTEDLLALTVASKKYKTPLCIGYCLRYLPSTTIVKEILDNGSLGTLYNSFISFGQYLPDWRPNAYYKNTVSANKELGGGALLELSHEFDYAQWLLGELTPIHSVLRTSNELDLNVEDIADITLHNNNGICHIHLDFLQRKSHRLCSFIGSKGRLDWDLITNKVCLINNENTTEIYNNPKWDKNLMYLDMINDFIGLIEGRANQCVKLEDATKTIHLIEQIKSQAIWKI